MTACPVCGARFVASGGAEREWLERHVVRAHGIQRMQLIAGWPIAASREIRPSAA